MDCQSASTVNNNSFDCIGHPIKSFCTVDTQPVFLLSSSSQDPFWFFTSFSRSLFACLVSIIGVPFVLFDFLCPFHPLHFNRFHVEYTVHSAFCISVAVLLKTIISSIIMHVSQYATYIRNYVIQSVDITAGSIFYTHYYHKTFQHFSFSFIWRSSNIISILYFATKTRMLWWTWKNSITKPLAA